MTPRGPFLRRGAASDLRVAQPAHKRRVVATATCTWPRGGGFSCRVSMSIYGHFTQNTANSPGDKSATKVLGGVDLNQSGNR